jgi:hypothetical protein
MKAATTWAMGDRSGDLHDTLNQFLALLVPIELTIRLSAKPTD